MQENGVHTKATIEDLMRHCNTRMCQARGIIFTYQACLYKHQWISLYYIQGILHLRSVGDDKVGGVNVVNEGSGQVDCTSTCVGHLLLGPGLTYNGEGRANMH